MAEVAETAEVMDTAKLAEIDKAAEVAEAAQDVVSASRASFSSFWDVQSQEPELASPCDGFRLLEGGDIALAGLQPALASARYREPRVVSLLDSEVSQAIGSDTASPSEAGRIDDVRRGFKRMEVGDAARLGRDVITAWRLGTFGADVAGAGLETASSMGGSGRENASDLQRKFQEALEQIGRVRAEAGEATRRLKLREADELERERADAVREAELRAQLSRLEAECRRASEDASAVQQELSSFRVHLDAALASKVVLGAAARPPSDASADVSWPATATPSGTATWPLAEERPTVGQPAARRAAGAGGQLPTVRRWPAYGGARESPSDACSTCSGGSDAKSASYSGRSSAGSSATRTAVEEIRSSDSAATKLRPCDDACVCTLRTLAAEGPGGDAVGGDAASGASPTAELNAAITGGTGAAWFSLPGRTPATSIAALGGAALTFGPSRTCAAGSARAVEIPVQVVRSRVPRSAQAGYKSLAHDGRATHQRPLGAAEAPLSARCAGAPVRYAAPRRPCEPKATHALRSLSAQSLRVPLFSRCGTGLVSPLGRSGTPNTPRCGYSPMRSTSVRGAAVLFARPAPQTVHWQRQHCPLFDAAATRSLFAGPLLPLASHPR